MTKLAIGARYQKSIYPAGDIDFSVVHGVGPVTVKVKPAGGAVRVRAWRRAGQTRGPSILVTDRIINPGVTSTISTTLSATNSYLASRVDAARAHETPSYTIQSEKPRGRTGIPYFRLKPSSPALRLSSVPIDLARVGLRSDENWKRREMRKTDGFPAEALRSSPRSKGMGFLWLRMLAAIAVPVAGLAEEANKDHYPEFAWDRVPLYMHIRKAKSYTGEEIAFLAKFPLITFEKANGHQDHGSVEAGTLKAAKAVKEINPKTKILYYRNVIVHYGGYQANKKLGQIPGAMLRDKSGNTKLVRNRVQAYDLSNAALREWWVNACSSMTSNPHIDGIFLDGNVKALERGYLARQIGAEKKRQTMAGYHTMMKQTREAIGPNKLMVANILRARFENAGLEYLDYFDGSYLEGFFHNVGEAGYEEYVAKGIAAMQKAARRGKIIAFTAGFATPGNTSALGIDEGHATVKSDEQAQAALTYSLAIFLVCAEKHSYFRIHEGYSANEDDRWMRWFPEYDRPLGPPNGPATKEDYRYTRKFQHATVQLDIRKRTSSIQWQEPANGRQRSPNGAKAK